MKTANLTLIGALMLGAVVLPAKSQETWHEEGWYLGAGVGLSRLNPDTGGTPYDVDISQSVGGKLYVGYDVTSRYGVEGYYAQLGTAELDPDGSIDYADAGASLLFYLWQQNTRREGWSSFGRVGIGRMMNDASVPYEREHDSHVMWGFGMEYGLQNGYAIRADLDMYDKDAQLLSVGVVKRFGAGKATVVAQAPAPVADVVRPEAPQPVAVSLPPEPAPVVEADDDGDGVIDRSDACPGTPAGTRVGARGCVLEEVIVLEGVTFETNSATLAGDSAEALASVAATLSRYPDMQVEIAGHTDSVGSQVRNKQLSQRRAETVRNYMVEHGIARVRLVAAGYGEEQPVADNETAGGRAKNRRVELHIVK